MFPESSQEEIKTAREIARSPDLYKYVDKKCLERYKSIHNTTIDDVTETKIRDHINKLLREKIRIAFPGLSESNENRLQLKAANAGEDPPKICYMCGSKCSNPHVEHVIRILLLYLLTYHLSSDHSIKQASLRYSHATCNMDAKGITSLFNMVVERDGVIKLTPVSTFKIGESIKSATSYRKSKFSQYGRPVSSANYEHTPREDIEEVNRQNITIRRINLNVSNVVKSVISNFNHIRVTAYDVVKNLNELINAIVPSVSQHFANIAIRASHGYEYSRKSRRNTAKGIKKRNKKTKKQRSKRT